MAENPSLTIKQACARMGCAYTTFLLWEDQGLAPRRTRLGHPRRDRVAVDELTLWEAQLERDRLATGKPHLRKPLRAESWTPEGQAREVMAVLDRANAGTVAPPAPFGRSEVAAHA